MPCIIFRNRGSWEEFVEKFFWAKLVHNSVGRNVPIVTDDICWGKGVPSKHVASGQICSTQLVLVNVKTRGKPSLSASLREVFCQHIGVGTLKNPWYPRPW